VCVLHSETNDYSYEMKQTGYTSIGVGMMFFVFMSMCGGNAAVARFLEKDKATIHNTKFLAHVSEFITYTSIFAITFESYFAVSLSPLL